MYQWIQDQPFLVAAAFLTCVVAFRAEGTYWLGRGVRAGVVRAAWAQKLASDNEKRVVAKLEKWGWPIIPLSFLTVGFQTAVQFTAGLIGWRWLPYTLAALPGWIAWGCVYAAGGLAVVAGILALAKQSWWLAVLAIVLVVVIILVIIRVRRRLKAHRAVVVESE